MQKAKKNMITKFLKILISMLLMASVVVSGGLYYYESFIYIPPYDPSLQQTILTIATPEDVENFNITKEVKTTAPVRTNFLVLGVDNEEVLTDVIMACSYISTTGEINILSVPRDTYVSFSGQDLTDLRKINSGAPWYMKINSVYPFTKSDGLGTLESTVENLLGIKFDYYVKVNLDAFTYIVDSVGGIYFDVPSGGLYYSDPTQNLKIALKGGYQLLDGEAAEGLVRYRSYAQADIQRVAVQQEFIKEFITQVVSKETFLDNVGTLAMSFIKYVETDFNVADLPKYLTSFSNIDLNNINTSTVPGDAGYIDELSYYIHNEKLLQEIVEDYFYGSTVPLGNNNNNNLDSEEEEEEEEEEE